MRSKAQGFRKRKLTKKQLTAIAQLIKSRKTEAFLEVFGRRLAAMAYHQWKKTGRCCVLVKELDESSVVAYGASKEDALNLIEPKDNLAQCIRDYDHLLQFVLLVAFSNGDVLTCGVKCPALVDDLYSEALAMGATDDELTHCRFLDSK